MACSLDSFSNPGYFIKNGFVFCKYVLHYCFQGLLQYNSWFFATLKLFCLYLDFFVTSFLKTFFQTVNNKIRFQISFIILVFSVIVILHGFLFIQKTFIKETLRLRCMDNYINQKLVEGRKGIFETFRIYGAISQILITEMSFSFPSIHEAPCNLLTSREQK